MRGLVIGTPIGLALWTLIVAAALARRASARRR
jgi:hypothetical protein